MSKKTNRRIIRERALQILYAFELNSEGLHNLIEGQLADIPNENDKEFCRSLTNKVIAKRNQIDEKISSRVANWEMARIALIDKILLRMGVAELMFFPEIPTKVTINEIIEIAKNFSTNNSGKFINGILDAICSELKKCGEMNKVGKGTIEETIPRKKKKNDER